VTGTSPAPVIVDLQGGLGNQLFQYAAGRALAAAYDAPLGLAHRLLDRDRKRRYALDAYPIKALRLSADLLPEPGPFRRLVTRLGVPNRWQTPLGLIDLGQVPRYDEDETQGAWDLRVVVCRPPVILRGYFQSPRYFGAIADLLRRELVPAQSAGELTHRFAQMIQAAGLGSVSLHLRRGDYVSDPMVRAKHGVLGPAYYRRAMERVRGTVPDPHWFIFTDDPAAAQAVLPAEAQLTVVSGHGLTEVEELDLMRTCRHHVIANSSFSWWGAWLGMPDGITIAPRRWFADGSAAGIRDRFPEDWVLIDEVTG
jgi:hypothetical protein